MKDKVLILGIAGFSGKHFLEYITKNCLLDTYEFIGVDSCDCNNLIIPTKKIDLSDTSNVSALLLNEYPDYIINLIGTFTSNDFSQLIKINVCISQSILNFSLTEKLNIKNVLLLGSAAEYGTNERLPIFETEKSNPVSMYGLSKVFQTEMAIYYANNYKINVTVARPFNLLGNGLSSALSIGSFVKQIKNFENNGSIAVGNINTKRDFIDISDAIDAYWKILINGTPGEIYNVCSGFSYSIKEVLDIIIKKSGKNIQVIVKDEHNKKNDILDSYGDNTKLKSLNWNVSSSLEDALVSML